MDAQQEKVTFRNMLTINMIYQLASPGNARRLDLASILLSILLNIKIMNGKFVLLPALALASLLAARRRTVACSSLI